MGEPLPDAIRNVEHLEDLLSEPTDAAARALARSEGDLLVLGAAGKMGPSLARMARRAFDATGRRGRVIAVSRFGDPTAREGFERHGVETLAADLLDARAIDALPDAPDIVYMAGMKFGASGNEPLTWALNSWLPGAVCRRWPAARIVAFSTGNVYPWTSVTRGGSVESDPPAPIGEYAMSCLGRERIFQHFAAENRQPVALLRLNYAVEMRYGVPVDIARRVLAGEPVPLATGMVNLLWQGDANAMALACFDAASDPARIVNLAGPEQISVRRLAEAFGQAFDRPPVFEGSEADTALLSNGQWALGRYGNPRVPVARLVEWVADWVGRGGASLGNPTKFEARDGRF